MSVAATAAAAKEARRADNMPQQCIKINKDILDALVKNLLKSASPGTQAAHLQPRVEQHLAKILPSIKTPDHPPYALMIRQAITELDEEGGSNEEAISEMIKLKYKDLPWGHLNFLRHHLKKLTAEEEIFQVSGNCYKLSPEGDDSDGKVQKSRKRRRQSGKEKCNNQCKVSKRAGSSKEKNYMANEDQEQSGAADVHFKECEVQKNQNEEQKKQEVTCGSRKESQLRLEVNEEVNQVHLDSEECERAKYAIREEALHNMKAADGLEQRKQEVTCPPRQETVLVVEVNEEVSQTHIVEDAGRDLNSAEERDHLLEMTCVPSQLGSETGKEVDLTQKECEGKDDVTPTAEASNRIITAEGQVLLQGQEKEFRESQSREVSCTTSKQTALGFAVNSEINQLCEQEYEKTEDGGHKEEENSVAIEEENSGKELSTLVIEDLQQGHRSEEVPRDVNQIEEQSSLQVDGQKEEREQTRAIAEQLKSQQFAVIEDLQQKERINEVIGSLIQVEEESNETEDENGPTIEGEKEEREHIKSIEEQKEANCKQDAIMEDLQNQMEVDPFQVEDDLDQTEEGNSLAIEREKEETTQINETEEQDAPTEKQGAAGVSEEQFDGKVVGVLVEVGKVSAIESQEQSMEMQGLSGGFEGKNVSKGAGNLTEKASDGSIQVALIEKGQVKAVGLQKQQQQWQPEVNEHHLQLKEIGAEIVECIERIITPQRNKSCTREREACGGHTTNLISSPTLSQEQCLELLNRTAKVQGIVVELLKSFRTAESSRRPSNETELLDEQLPNATAETALPSCRDTALVELPLNLDLPGVEPPLQNVEEASMLDSQCLNKGKHSTASEAEQQEASSDSAVLKDSEEQLQHQEVAVAIEPKEQIEKLCSSSANTTTTLQLEETMVENHREKQQPQVVVVGEEATKTALPLNLNSTMSGEQEALNNKEPSVENSSQPKLPDLQPETNLSTYLEGKEIPGPTVSAEPTLLSLSPASQELQKKPTDFVDGNQQLLHQQKEELPTPVSQQNAEPSFCQQHVQSESQSVNLVKITENNEVLQPNLLQGGPKVPLPFKGDTNSVIFGTPQKQLLHDQQKQMLSPVSTQAQLPSAFDAGSLFRNSLFQKPEQPLTISLMKPSPLSGGKLQPLKPKELKKLMKESGMPEEEVTPKKRRGRPPKQKPPGHTPSPRPKIRQTVPKKRPPSAADGEEGVSSQSPAKRGPGRPPKRVKVAAAMVEKEPVIIPKNPF